MKKGFTLIETLISIALFSILVAIAAGAFTNALRTQREVAGLIAAQSNASLALEQVAREVRTGYLFCHDIPVFPSNVAAVTCSCTVNGSTWTCGDLNFRNAQTLPVHYTWDGKGLLRSQNGSVPQPITGDNVIVKYLTFTLFGNSEGDHWNPRITISMGVSPNSNDAFLKTNVLNLQTTISARGVDCSTTGC